MNHRRWIGDVEELQDTKITFPLFADHDGAVSKVLGMVRPGTVGNAAHAIVPAGLTIIIDMDKRIRFISQYPATTGRNFYEILRVIDTLQLTLFHAVATPANWMQGEDVFVRNDISTTAAGSMFPKGFMAIKEWFRITPQPDTKT